MLKNEKEQVAQNLIVVHVELDRVNASSQRRKSKTHFKAKENRCQSKETK